MTKQLYPLKFYPILKDKLWGGQRLRDFNKISNLPNIGESWEISDVEGDTSTVANGPMEGTSLKTLLQTFKGDLIGNKNYQTFGDKFPLLIKFIDAEQDLSIQLHPNDTLAAERHNSFGKTEMWYVMQSEAEAKLIVGFNQKVDPPTYLEHLESKTLTEILNFETVKEGDAFFIEVGRIHAIGAGVMVAEIQQTSDVTYRVYDWDRVDAQGNQRELHNDLAIDAIDFDMPNDFKKSYEKTPNASNGIVDCPYFHTSFLPVVGRIEKHNTQDSFMIYMCVEGKASFAAEGTHFEIQKGETILIPACVKDYEINANSAKLLEVYV